MSVSAQATQPYHIRLNSRPKTPEFTRKPQYKHLSYVGHKSGQKLHKSLKITKLLP